MYNVRRFQMPLDSVFPLCAEAPPDDALINSWGIGRRFGKRNPFHDRPKSDASSYGGLWFHNRSAQTVFLALAYFEEGAARTVDGNPHRPAAAAPGGWRVSGWYAVPPGQTVQTTTDIRSRWYYYYTVTADGHEHRGYKAFFVHPREAFSYNNGARQALILPTQHHSRGFVQKDFREIDTGNRSPFFMNLD
ncbi:DUF1036 domain-containing protein [Paludisphaera rhizosphaerae]|uniref:DUF1036 domain-containing protein n=1 Tax=Paludisphaera rhizosphaerae TaxID=2711216 RepID=UPI0013ECB56B|nr:DUF1036 domain-containing protein [Paludisphaera rhizosphaerae]